MLNWKVIGMSVGVWSAIAFMVCVTWGVLTPEALHMHGFLELVLPGFDWLTWGGFLLGLVESFLYGFYAGAVYAPIHNFFTRWWLG